MVFDDCVKPQGDFNPRSREGSDEAFEKAAVKLKEFQSTLP